MNKFFISEDVFNKARMLWLKENAAQCMLLGSKFETMHWDRIGEYVAKAVKEEQCSTCGKYHKTDEAPIPCRTGDGV